jgi:hypothetical protein
MATYQHIRSSTAHKRPTTSIADGQLAINTNTASPGLFFKDSAGTGIVKVGPVHVGTTAPNSSPAVGGSSGNYLGEQWLDTSVSPAQMKVWNGSAWVGIVADELPVSKLQDGAARQLIQTDAAGTGVEWTSNIDVPGTLDVTSTATFDSIAQHPLGTAGAPTITFTGDNNTGLYSPGADQLALATGGTGRLFVDASGRVGVGTSSPQTLLNLRAASGNAILRLENSNTAVGVGEALGAVEWYSNDSSTGGTAVAGKINVVDENGFGTAYGMGFYTGVASGGSYALAERVRIDELGRVGIGTSSVNTTLEVLNSSTPIIRVGDGLRHVELRGGSTTQNASVGTNYAGAFEIIQNGSAAITIDTSKRVGIGTTAPLAKLHVNNGTNENIHFTTGGSGDQRISAINDANNATVQLSLQGSPLLFRGSGGSEVGRWDTSGRFLVGTSSSPSAGQGQYARIVAQGYTGGATGGGYISLQRGEAATAITAEEELGLINFGDSAGNTFGTIACRADATAGAGDYPGRLAFSTTADGASSPTERLRITSAGAVTFSNGSIVINGTAIASGAGNSTLKWNTSTGIVTYDTSSRLVKENIVDCPYGIDALKQLQPRKYFRTDDQREEIGFIADEMIQVIPEFVPIGPKSVITKDEKDTEQIPIGVNYEKLTAVLAKALQEAVTKIESLEARLTAAGI